jgi:hypothetical protein
LWQYRDADLEFGSLQAELEDHLPKYLRTPVISCTVVSKGDGYVEPRGVNKVLAMRVIKHLNSAVQKEGLTSRLQLGMIIATSQCSVMHVKSVDGGIEERGKERTLFLICPQRCSLVDVSPCDNFIVS